MLLLTQTTVPKIDLTITISVIVALAAIISPIFTTIINNRHQSKLKKMELNQKQFESTVLYKRTIFENYLRSAGKCITQANHESFREYGEYYLIALMYAPESINLKMLQAHNFMAKYKWEEAARVYEELSPMIYSMLQNM